MGWIKLEKDLLTDPRMIAAGARLEARYELIEVTGESDHFIERNASPLHGVTLLIGCLATLWMIADTHVGQDDVLALGADQIDKLVGVRGFCEILPTDWLQILDGNRVKLPNYHGHNGTVAKERALAARRVAKHRYRVKRSSVTRGNGPALPDQDQDQDLKSAGRAPYKARASGSESEKARPSARARAEPRSIAEEETPDRKSEARKLIETLAAKTKP